MSIQPASGTKDLNPQQVEQNQYLLTKLSLLYKQWGYEEVAPPKIERIQTLIAGGGISRKDILKLVADEPLGLRPEMTASIARFASTRLSKKARPLRLWSNGTVFKSREDSDGKVSIEESLQSGVELFGTEGMAIEIELLYLLLESLKQVEIDKVFKPKLLIGHTSLLKLVLANIDDDLNEEVKEALINFDLIKIKKLKILQEDRHKLQLIQKLRGEPESIIESLCNIYGRNTILDSLSRLFKILKPIGEKYKIKIQLDPTYKAKFDLYTGVIFKLVCESQSAPVVIARGGRYDDLAKRFGNSSNNAIGAGFSFYIDKIRELNKYYFKEKDSGSERILVAFGPDRTIEDALEKQKILHQKGYTAILELEECQTHSDAQALLLKRGCVKLEWINN